MIIEPIYSDIIVGINGIHGLYSCFLNEKSGVINNKGEVIVPFIYKHCSIYYGQITVLDTNMLYGALDSLGNEILPCVFDNISFTENIYKATKGDFCYYFNEQGQQLTTKNYSKTSRDMYDNYALVVKNGKYGLIDKSGNEFVKCSFSYIAAITNNPRKFILGRNNLFYVVDISGVHELKY